MSASELHYNMCLAIGGNIHPNLEHQWSEFTFLLRQHLNAAQVGGIKNAMDAINLLEQEGHITTGNYTVLLKIFQSMNHQIVCDIIRDYTKKIQDADIGSSNTGPTSTRSNQGNQAMGPTNVTVHGNVHVGGDFLANKSGK